MRWREILFDIVHLVILGSILFEYSPDKNEVGIDYDVTNINRLTLSDLAENEDEKALLLEFQSPYSILKERSKFLIMGVDGF